MPELLRECAKNLRMLIHLEYSCGHADCFFGIYQRYPLLRTFRESQFCCCEAGSPIPTTRTIRVSIIPNSDGRAKRRTLLRPVGPNPFVTCTCNSLSGIRGSFPILLSGHLFSYRGRVKVSGHLTPCKFGTLPDLATDKTLFFSSKLFFAVSLILVSSFSMFGKPFCQVSIPQSYSLYSLTKSWFLANSSKLSCKS